MSIAGELKQIASELAQGAQARMADLQRQLTDVETRKAQIEADLKAARLSPERVFNFQPQIGGDFQCPRCWIQNETKAVLAPIGGGTKTEDFFRCRTCGFEISLPA